MQYISWLLLFIGFGQTALCVKYRSIIRRNKLIDSPIRFNVFVDIKRRCKRTNKMWVVVGTIFCILQSNFRRTFYYGSFTCIHINLLLSTIVQYYQMSLNIMFLIEYNVNLFERKCLIKTKLTVYIKWWKYVQNWKLVRFLSYQYISHFACSIDLFQGLYCSKN